MHERIECFHKHCGCGFAAGWQFGGTFYYGIERLIKARGRDQTIGQADTHTFPALKLISGKPEKFGIAPSAFLEKPAGGAYIRKKTDPGFGHGHAGGFVCRHDIRTGGQAETSAHGNPMGKDNYRFVKTVKSQIKIVLHF